MKIGCARVSTTGQNLDVQRAKLEAAGCEKIFQEKKSWATKAERLELTNTLQFMREGDQFLVTRLDRLARSLRDLADLTKQMAEKQVDLVVLDQNIDTSTPTWRLLFHMLAAIGEFERDLIKERAADGIARATANGVKFGEKPKHQDIDMELLQMWFDRPETDRTELARKYDISRSTLYRWCGGKNNAAAPDRNS